MWSMFTLNRLVDSYFLADMVINFNTAVFDAKSGCWITDRRFIAERYFERWFAIDVISILPYDILSVSKSFNRFRLLRTLKVLKLLKLLRVVRIGRLLNWWASRLQLSFRSLSVLRFVFIIIVPPRGVRGRKPPPRARTTRARDRDRRSCSTGSRARRGC